MSTRIISELRLRAANAEELMRHNPISIGQDAPIQDALELFCRKSFSAAPVIDESGRTVGVISQSDIVVHDCHRTLKRPAIPEYYRTSMLEAQDDFDEQVEHSENTRVGDLMTPCVFAVGRKTPAAEVIRQFLTLRVHRLFVVDEADVLIGVISALDVLSALSAD